MLSLYGRMGYDAMVPAEHELAFGVKFLLDEARRAKLPLVASNLVYAAHPSKHVTKDFFLLKKGGVRVAVFGLEGSDLTFTTPAGDADSVRALDPIETARALVPKLRKKADVVVCLAHTSYFPAQKIAQDVPGIDVVVVGHAPGQGEVAPTASGPIYPRSGQRGQSLAKTTVDITDGRITNLASTIVALGGGIRLDEALAAAIKNFEDSMNATSEAQQQKAATSGSAPADAAPAGTAPAGDKYLGAESCGRCHQAIYTQWKQTKHGHAMQTLVDAHEDANAECIGCHTVGFHEPTGFVSQAATPTLANVQCEVCHGMGTKHAEYTTVTEAACKKCHIAERDPEFKFESRWAQIKH